MSAHRVTAADPHADGRRPDLRKRRKQGFTVRRGVVVPPELAAPVLRALIRDFTTQTRNGRSVPRELAELARALHLAAETAAGRPVDPPAVSARGSEPERPGRLITTAGAARLIGCTPRRVRQLLAAGRLAGEQVDGHGTWMVDAGSVRGWQRGRRDERGGGG